VSLPVEIVNGPAVSQFLQRVTVAPSRYREIVVCTPFLDDQMASAVRELAVSAPRAHCGFTLLTRREAARRVLDGLPAPLHRWLRSIHVRHRIHAKVYVAVGRAHHDSEAIVTSANLTIDGVRINDELGVRFTGRTPLERLAFLSVKNAVHKWLY
jgi:phosphatidylserine/phosphatidylglycerophosphate/cardiolipin synthase-like enzyme